jgi:hypothetical protein
MAWALDEFFSALESEFDVELGDSARDTLTTPGEVVDYLLEHSDAGSELPDDDSRREHVAGLVGEIMAETLGVTRYRDHWRFVEDLHVR